ncbi:MAG TPA: normocyte-binding protein [Bacillus bacterium]|nr:normocyte-binding protein [Bacillus sp. (in: firmicutes)]
MKETILDRLQRMENLEERKLLKDIVSGVFMNLVEYQEDMNRKLEERVFSELEDLDDRFDIYCTICSRDNIDPIHEFLFPMIPKDLEKDSFTIQEQLDSVGMHGEFNLFTIYLQCEFPKIKELLDSQRLFAGVIVTTSGKYDVNIMLKQNKTYIEEIEKLYHLFLLNGLSWKTVNHPFAYKFFDVIITDFPCLKEEEEIIEISYDLEEYEAYKKINMIPLWNIEKLTVKSSGFPSPAKDKVNYEHTISIRKMGEQNGYLVDSDEKDIRYVKRSKDVVTVVSAHDKSGLWNLLKIAKPLKKTVDDRQGYALVSNRRNNHFIQKYAQKNTMAIRTKSEVMRIINSFEAAKDLELVDIDLQDIYIAKEICYPMNAFLIDNIRVEKDKKIMIFRFKAQVERNFILNDTLSFLTSEAQMYFPEYKCVGEWA